MNSKSKPLFISHAVADHKLVQAFVDFLEEGIGVPEIDIFCTSIKGKGIPTGKKFVEYIKNQINGPKIVILMLTQNYYESNFCMAELGASWVKSHDIYPIIIPPLTYNDVEDVLLGIQVTKISDSIKLNELREQLTETLGFDPKPGYKWDVKRELFLERVTQILPDLPKPDKISREEYEKLEEKNTEYLEGLKEYGLENDKLKDLVEKLKKAKDKEEITSILRQDTGEQEIYEELVTESEAHLNDLPAIVVYLLFKNFNGEPHVIFNAFEEREQLDDANRAEEDGFLKHNGEYFELNNEDPSVSDALGQLNRMNEFLETEITNEFYDSLKEKLGIIPEMSNRRYWKEELYNAYLY